MKRTLTTLLAAPMAAFVLLLTAVGCADSSSVDDNPSPDPDNPPEQPSGAYVAINQRVFDILKRNYLWNRAVQQTKPDYALDYQEFLYDVLLQVAAQNDVNRDDGHLVNGKHTSFYSYILRYTNSLYDTYTRASFEGLASGYGLDRLFLYLLEEPYCFFAVGAVHPDSPAAQAGLQRGDMIMRVNGERIVWPDNANQLYAALLAESGTVTLTLGDLATFQETRTVKLTTATYADNPVVDCHVDEIERTDKTFRIGYLHYSSFSYYYDDKLIEAFADLRDAGIDELVIDLRYNGGGHALSCAVLGSLVAGAAHQGKSYLETRFNEDRRAEPADCYRIGEASYNTADAPYAPIAEAMDAALGLSRVYLLVTADTSSASEALINGLRGLGIEVRLVGETTDGKNVGMEVYSWKEEEYTYEYGPISFYVVNGEGFGGYGDGFDPDVEESDSPWLYLYNDQNKFDHLEYASQGDPWSDYLYNSAVYWIVTGDKPAYAAASAVATRGSSLQLPARIGSGEPLHRMPQQPRSPRRHRPEGFVVDRR